jgi:hypothetical protein
MASKTVGGKRSGAISLKLDLQDGDAIQEMISRDSGLFAITIHKIIRLRSPDQNDPDNHHPNAPWEQSIYLPHGSSDYLVARTVIQTRRILGLPNSLQSAKKSAVDDLSWEVMNSLVSLRFIRDRLFGQISKICSDVEGNLPVYTQGENPKPLPIVEYFDIEFRSFVNEVRRVLTKIGELFGVLTEKEIPAGHFHEALKWAQSVGGADSELTKMLTRDLRWIKTWIDLRVAIEHPKADKFVETRNFALEANRTVTLPTWRFVHPDYDMARPQNLLDVFDACIGNLLGFYEDILIVLLGGHGPKWLQIMYRTIPEDERDPMAPVRYSIETYSSLGSSKNG